MGDVVKFPLDGDRRHELTEDLARYADGTLDQKFIKKKYRLDDATWEALGADDALVEAVEAAKLSRIRDGSTKREKAQQLVVQAPDVLNGIMLDTSMSARHRVDAIKTLDTFAANGPNDRPAATRFVISIDLGGDHIERFSKSIEINPNDTDPDDIGSAQTLAAIAANKPQDDDNGSGHL